MAGTEVDRNKEMVPTGLLIAVAALVVTSLVIAGYARLTDRPLVGVPPDLPVLEERVLQLHGTRDGAVTVIDDTTGAVIADLKSGESGFVSIIWLTLNRERQKFGIETSAPLRLVRFSDGHLGLRDDLTGWSTELVGFGADNKAAFERLLQKKDG